MSATTDRLVALVAGWSADPGPRSRALADRIARLIEGGQLADGEALPTERSLAASLAIGRSTATAAYDELRERGLVVSVQGSGSWVRRPHGTPPGPRGSSHMFATLGSDLGPTIDLGLAEIRRDEATRAALADLDPAWLTDLVRGTGYHPAGLPAARARLAAWLGTSPDRLLLTAGAQQAIRLVTELLCPPGSAVLVEDATYPGALEVFRRARLRVVPVPTDRHGVDPDALAALLPLVSPAMAYLVPIATNPTGVVTPPQRLDAIAGLLAASRTPVLEDRTPALLADPDVARHRLATRLPDDQVVTVGSISKVAWAGVRVGWALATPRLVEELVAARIGNDLAGSLPGQAIAAHLVPHLDALCEQARAATRDRIELVVRHIRAELPSWQVTVPAAGGWLWVEVPGVDAGRLVACAADHGVLVTPGTAFSSEGRWANHVRIAAVADEAELVTGVRRLASAWRELVEAPAPRREPAAALTL